MTGANTVVLLDGKPLKGIKKLELTIDAGGLASLKLDMIANVTFEGDIEPIYQIGDLSPAIVGKETK